MDGLAVDLRLDRADAVYERLVESYADLSPDQVGAFHAALVLLLFNHVGDERVIAEAIAAAREAAMARRSR